MPLSETSKDVLESMKDQYGEEKGESVFYATANKKDGPAEEASTWEKDENGKEKESAAIQDLLDLGKVAGADARGVRTGTGPFRGSFQAGQTGSQGKRLLRGEVCPVTEEGAEVAEEEEESADVGSSEKKSSLLDEVLHPNLKQAQLEKASDWSGLEKEAGPFISGGAALGRAIANMIRRGGRTAAKTFRGGRQAASKVRNLGGGKPIVAAPGQQMTMFEKTKPIWNRPVSKGVAGAAMATPVAAIAGRELLDPGQAFESAQAAQNRQTDQYHAARDAARRQKQTDQAMQLGGRIGDALKTALIYGGIPAAGAYGLYSLLSGNEEEEEEEEEKRRR